MEKRRKNKSYSAEFKISVIMDMREHHLSYHKTARKYLGASTHSEEGWQYQRLLSEHNLTQSMSRKDNCMETVLWKISLVGLKSRCFMVKNLKVLTLSLMI